MNPILVLDDQIIKSNSFGVLPAGLNRSENLYRLLKRAGLLPVLYDGRDSEGKTEFSDPIHAFQALMHKLEEAFSFNEETPLKVDVVLDLQWFGDDTYGERFFGSLYYCKKLEANRVVVWSVITDVGFKLSFSRRFKVPIENICDRGQVPPERVRDYLLGLSNAP